MQTQHAAITQRKRREHVCKLICIHSNYLSIRTSDHFIYQTDWRGRGRGRRQRRRRRRRGRKLRRGRINRKRRRRRRKRKRRRGIILMIMIKRKRKRRRKRRRRMIIMIKRRRRRIKRKRRRRELWYVAVRATLWHSKVYYWCNSFHPKHIFAHFVHSWPGPARFVLVWCSSGC